MLPTINLQLSEFSQFDTSAGTLTPEGADEPTAVFADVLAVKAAGPEGTGESLPPTGNALPLLPDPIMTDPELSADLGLEAGELLTPNPEGLAPLTDAELAPASIVDESEVVVVTLDLEPVPDIGPGVPPAEELLVTPELELPIQDLNGKEIEPATPPGPFQSGNRGEITGAGPIPDAPATLLRDADPQMGADATLRPILAAAAPPVAADPDAAFTASDALERSLQSRTPVPDSAAARVVEARIPVTAEAAPAASDATRLEPLNQTVQSAAPTAQMSAQNTASIADSIAEGVAELRSASDTAAVTRAAAEPQAPRQVQSILQPINTPVQQPDWDQAVSERIVMMANNKLQQAEIRLTPAELGPLRVQVSVDDGAANVSFQAQHAMTREAIEQALPRLRELFAENGLSLGQTSVGQEGAADGGESRTAEVEASKGEGADIGIDESEAEVVRTRVESGLVDTFV
ncbi:MAG: flagellar hook-length control protein FliK [Woeseiaceae bacterium]|nr:flagellar hook-length control protein FliK [Woeseiaceae bacterium]